MFEQNVSANSLSCLMCECSTAEIYPEPFRMQSSIVFGVTYLEYSKYILSLSEDSDIRLMANIAMLRNLASNHNPKLYSYYLADMAFAICKEIYFAECYALGASVILPINEGVNAVRVSECQQTYQTNQSVYASCERELRQKLTDTGFELPKSFRDHNGTLFHVAVILYYLSKLTELTREVNIVYDLK